MERENISNNNSQNSLRTIARMEKMEVRLQEVQVEETQSTQTEMIIIMDQMEEAGKESYQQMLCVPSRIMGEHGSGVINEEHGVQE